MIVRQRTKIISVIKILKEPKYLGLTFGLSLLMLFLYPVIQVLPQGLNNFWFWFSLLTPLRWVLYLFHSILFGMTISFFFWQRSKKACSFKKATGGGFFGLMGSVLGTSMPLCPACLSWIALLLPLSFALSLARYSVEIMIFSILLLFLTLWFLGGFRKS